MRRNGPEPRFRDYTETVRKVGPFAPFLVEVVASTYRNDSAGRDLAGFGFGRVFGTRNAVPQRDETFNPGYL